ncbi:hypothetical protein ED733_007093 [Metarhizium rileyi]|uniref:Peptidase M13 N-terminal domain-containing protein n=1 Tax=Metarhizium rileyi (strain RCEF 4871) TaxID=1649241 RepID=A0A5C6GP67_METRR|nr:hypothetical protein ED733_007093 [Metarhizium rileyi]
MDLAAFGDTYGPPNGTCIAPDCNDFWSALQDSRGDLGSPSDYCYRWTRFVCGHHVTRSPGDEGPVVVIDGVIQAVFETVHSMIDPSYKSVTVVPSTTRTHSGGNYTTEDVALLESLISTDGPGAESAPTTTTFPYGKTGSSEHRRDGSTSQVSEAKATKANAAVVSRSQDPTNRATITAAPVQNTTKESGEISLDSTARHRDSFTNDGPQVTTTNPFGNTTFNVTLSRAPSQPSARTASLWAQAHRYFNACMSNDDPETSYSVLLDLMEEVRRPFSAMDHMAVFSHGDQQDTYMLSMDTTVPTDNTDASKASAAMTSLARYGIFPLFRFGPGAASLSNTTQTRPFIAPNPLTGIGDPALYNSPPAVKQYERMLEIIMPKLHGSHAAEIQEMYGIAANMVKLEKALLKILPKRDEWLDVRQSIRSMTLEELNATNPLRLDEILPAMVDGTRWNTTVDVLFPDSLRKYWFVLCTFSKETLRSYMMWQTFLQTEELWNMAWVEEWRAFKQSPSDVVKPQPRRPGRDESCVGKVQRHFGHLVSARLMEDVFAQRDGKDAVFKVADVMARVGHAHGCPRNIADDKLGKIYKDADTHAGKPDTARWQGQSPARVTSLSRPGKWSHLHDWFNLEKLQWTRSWTALHHPSDRDECLNLVMSFQKDGVVAAPPMTYVR